MPGISQRFARTSVLIALLAAVVLLSGCAAAAEKTEFAGPDWSRGIRVGKSHINNRPSILWDSASANAVISYLTNTEQGWRIQIARVNAQAQVSATTLPFPMRAPTRQQMVGGGQGTLHLFWLDTPSGQRPGLYHARATTDGTPLDEPVRISGDASDVTGYCTFRVAEGALDVLWSDVSHGDPQMFHARLADSGEIVIVPHALGIAGADPYAAVDTSGMVHLAWHLGQAMSAEKILYATLDPASLQVSEPTVMASFPMGTGLALYPPEVALETGWVYVIWSLEQRGGGLTPGTAETLYQAFPIGQPQRHSGGPVYLPALAKPEYQAASGAFNYAHLYPLASRNGGAVILRSPSDYVYMQYAVPGQRDEAALFVSSSMALPRRTGKIQIAFALLDDGRVKGYEVAVRTLSGSLRPAVAVDDEGAFHLACLGVGGFGTYEVLYASTLPAVRAVLNRMTGADVMALLLGKTWSAASALSFFPMLVIWLFLPFAWLVGFYLARPDADLNTRPGRVGLIVAIVLYLFSKLFMLPAFLWYAPFLDVVPPRYEWVVLFGFPALLLGLGVLAMRAYIRRSERKVVMFAFAIFAATDAILSLIFYMPNAMGG
ncbi:MAG: hypothetical protein QHH80_10210 [Anaerolineae bacterium]|nr:hypothetical protein [Anaerolineae bacterium]